MEFYPGCFDGFIFFQIEIIMQRNVNMVFFFNVDFHDF